MYRYVILPESVFALGKRRSVDARKGKTSRYCDGVTFLHKSCGRPTRGTTTPPRQLPPGTPAAALLHRRTDADRPPIPKTSHSAPTRDHSVPVGYYLILIPSRLILIPSRQILPSRLARLPSSPPDTHRPPPPSARYTITIHFYGQFPENAPGYPPTPQARRRPPTCIKRRPPYRSARDFSRLHQLTAAAGEDQFRREATLYHRPSHPTPGLPCQNTPSPARFGSTPDALPTHQSDGHINGSSPVVTSHQPANRLLPLSPNSVDRRRPLGRCQSVRVSAPGRVMTLRRAADTIPAAAPCRPSRSGTGNDR